MIILCSIGSHSGLLLDVISSPAVQLRLWRTLPRRDKGESRTTLNAECKRWTGSCLQSPWLDSHSLHFSIGGSCSRNAGSSESSSEFVWMLFSNTQSPFSLASLTTCLALSASSTPEPWRDTTTTFTCIGSRCVCNCSLHA